MSIDSQSEQLALKLDILEERQTKPKHASHRKHVDGIAKCEDCLQLHYSLDHKRMCLAR